MRGILYYLQILWFRFDVGLSDFKAISKPLEA